MLKKKGQKYEKGRKDQNQQGEDPSSCDSGIRREQLGAGFDELDLRE